MKLPQLSLRDLFWIVLVSALVVGWWIDHVRTNRLAETHRKESEWLKQVLANLGWTIGKSGPDNGQAVPIPLNDFQIPPLEGNNRW